MASDRLRSSHWSTYHFTTGIFIQHGQVFAFQNKRIDNTETRNTEALVTFRDRLHKWFDYSGTSKSTQFFR